MPIEQEVADCRKEVERITAEVDVLKKWQGWFQFAAGAATVAGLWFGIKAATLPTSVNHAVDDAISRITQGRVLVAVDSLDTLVALATRRYGPISILDSRVHQLEAAVASDSVKLREALVPTFTTAERVPSGACRPGSGVIYMDRSRVTFLYICTASRRYAVFREE